MLKFIVEKDGRFGFGWNKQSLITANPSGWFVISLTIWLFVSGKIIAGLAVVAFLLVMWKMGSYLIDKGENHESENMDIER